MESGSIPDSSINASTYYDTRYYPWNGRLNTKIGSCSWTPTYAGINNSWFQVDLGKLTFVTGMAIQGSCTIDEWAKSYYISYSTDFKQWLYYQEEGKNKVSKLLALPRGHGASLVYQRGDKAQKQKYGKAMLEIEKHVDCSS